jgi:hypothetical protein
MTGYSAGGALPNSNQNPTSATSFRRSYSAPSAHSCAADGPVGVAGGPIGVHRPEDRLTPPALRRAACDITSPRTGSSSLPCPRRPHELRASTIPSRRSFFGFAGPVDGAHGELTRQRHHLFRRSTQKRAARKPPSVLSPFDPGPCRKCRVDRVPPCRACLSTILRSARRDRLCNDGRRQAERTESPAS